MKPCGFGCACKISCTRQDITFRFVITEAALRYAVAPYDVLLGQLDKLLVATALRNVQLGVIPLACR